MTLNATPVRTDEDGDVVFKLVGDAGANQGQVTSAGELKVSVPDTVTVTDNGALDVASLPEPLDVSSATVTVTDNGTFDINSLPEPLDVSSATVTITDDGAFDVNSLPEPVDVSAQTVTVTDNGSFVADADLRVGTTPVSATNPVPIEDAGTSGSPRSQFAEATGVAPSNSNTLSFSIANSTTGRIRYVNVSGDAAFKADIQTFDGTTASTVAIGYGDAGDEFVFNPEDPDAASLEQANTASGEEFRVVVTHNGDTIAQNGDFSCTFQTVEV
jgi:hypothetical protein